MLIVKFGPCIYAIPEEQWAATAQHSGIPDLSQHFGQEYLLETNLTYMFWWWRKPEDQEEIHTKKERNSKKEIHYSSWESYPRPSCCEATVLTTDPPHTNQ